jgi:hypothetical protein
MPNDLRTNKSPATGLMHEGELTVGRVLYWLATVVAVLIVIFAVGDFFIGWAQGTPILRIVAFIAAAVAWLIGRICRSLLP